jgi:hypothetical protein
MARDPKKPTDEATEADSKKWGPEVPGTDQVQPGLYVAKESKSIFVAFAATPKPAPKSGP